MDEDTVPEKFSDLKIVGSGEYYSRCKSCENDPDCPSIVYLSDNPHDVKREARDHEEWHKNHRPIARGPDGERIYR